MLIKEREINGGIQKLYKFNNNYGASVVKHSFSYGHELGLWELAVIKFEDEECYDISYDTGITDDVIGNLTLAEVETILKDIENLR